MLGILACRYLKPLTVIVSDPHTVLVDPTVLDFAISAGGALGSSTGHGLGMLPVVLQPCDDNHVIEGTGQSATWPPTTWSPGALQTRAGQRPWQTAMIKPIRRLIELGL